MILAWHDQQQNMHQTTMVRLGELGDDGRAEDIMQRRFWDGVTAQDPRGV